MGKKLTLNDFVQRANIIHKFKYDYSKVKIEYIKYNENIESKLNEIIKKI